MLRTGRLPAPHRGRSSSASTPGSRPTPGVLLPGTLASPRTGLTPAGCRELIARLRRGAPPFGGPRRPSYWTHIPQESRPRRWWRLGQQGGEDEIHEAGYPLLLPFPDGIRGGAPREGA